MPAIPFRWDSFAVPVGMEYHVQVLDSAYTDTAFVLTPSYPPQAEDALSITVEKIKEYDGFYPNTLLKKSGIQEYKGVGLINICIWPVQYDMRNNTIRSYSMIRYKLSYDKKSSCFSQSTNSLKTLSHLSDSFLKNIVLYDDSERNDVQRPKKVQSSISYLDNRNYLIITTPIFENAVNEFATWKRTKGMNVIVESSTSWTVSAVKNCISYVNSVNPLSYLLIVGDFQDVPAEKINLLNPHYTDLYYTCENVDDVPDFFQGRIPVSTNKEAEIVFSKIRQYEKEPVNNSSFYNSGLNCAYFQDNDEFDTNHNKTHSCDTYENRRYVLTSERILTHLVNKNKTVYRVYNTEDTITPLYYNQGWYGNGEPLDISLLKSNGFNWNGGPSDIANRINSGCFYVLHRDHGSIGGWWKPRFKISNLSLLSNGNKLPVVFSLNCHTGEFNDNCFAENFLKLPNGGCVGIFAASHTSYSGYNDALAEGMFDAIWPGLTPQFKYTYQNNAGTTPVPTFELGQILTQGLQRMCETYGMTSSTYRIYTKEIFHCFGDPSMRIYTQVPSTFATPTITVDFGKVTVQSNDGDARISFYDPNTNEVTAYQGSYVQHSTDAGKLVVCLDRPNYKPYIKEVLVDRFIQDESPTGYVTYEGRKIKVGKNVTSTKPQGDVLFVGGVFKVKGQSVELHPGTVVASSILIIETSE